KDSSYISMALKTTHVSWRKKVIEYRYKETKPGINVNTHILIHVNGSSRSLDLRSRVEQYVHGKKITNDPNEYSSYQLSHALGYDYEGHTSPFSLLSWTLPGQYPVLHLHESRMEVTNKLPGFVVDGGRSKDMPILRDGYISINTDKRTDPHHVASIERTGL